MTGRYCLSRVDAISDSVTMLPVRERPPAGVCAEWWSLLNKVLVSSGAEEEWGHERSW